MYPKLFKHLKCFNLVFAVDNFRHNYLEGYRPMSSKGFLNMQGLGNQLGMFNGKYPNGGIAMKGGFMGYPKIGFDGKVGYPKSGLIKGGFQNGMSEHFNGGNGGYLNEMLSSGLYPAGFDGWNSFANDFGLGFQGFGGYPNNRRGFGSNQRTYRIKGFKKGNFNPLFFLCIKSTRI